MVTIHTGLSGEDLELRHTVFWCIYPSSRGDLFIRGTNYFFVNFLMIWYFVSFLTFLKVKLLLVYLVFSAHILFHWPKTMRYVTMLLITLSEKKIIVITLFKSIQPLLQALQVILTCVFMELLKREMEDRKRKKSRTYRKGSDFFFPSVSEESLMWLKKD